MADPEYCPLADQVGVAKNILGQDASGEIVDGAFRAKSGDGKTSIVALPNAVGAVVAGEEGHVDAAVVSASGPSPVKGAVDEQAKAATVAGKFFTAPTPNKCKFGGPRNIA